MHPRLEEILAYLARVRSELAALIASAPHEAFSRQPPDGGWTGSQIVYHLGNTEGSIAKLFEGLFAKALADGLPADENTGSLLHSLDHLRVPDRAGRRIKAPERLQPPAEPDLDASWDSLQKVRERTHRAVATVDGRDLTRLSAPHPIFGPLNAYEWVLIIGQHEERHMGQMRETLSRE
jgi:uncharacterized damage-inducible protein DinB